MSPLEGQVHHIDYKKNMMEMKKGVRERLSVKMKLRESKVK
jgi:hypothetical protein